MQNHFELIRIFCAAAEASSFREAAAYLGKSPQAVTRAIKELEAIRGEILFYRSTRNIRITSSGEELAAKAREMINKIDELVSHTSTSNTDEIEANVSLTLPVSLGRHIIMPVINAFQQNYPSISITCTLTDSHSDVIDEKIDIGLRTGFLRDNRYVARKIREVNFFVLGTPELIHSTGIPESLEQLARMPVLALLDHKTGRFWPWLFDDARTFTPSSPRFITDDLDAYTDSMLNGTGYGQLADYLALPLMKKGLLIPVLEQLRPTSWSLYIYRPQRGPVPRRVRLLFDYLTEHLVSFNPL